MKKESVRLKDVAEAAGVSVSAVSKALLGNQDISHETAARIARIANEIGYKPNGAARSLRLGKTHRLGVLLPNFSNAYAGILDGIEAAAKPHGYTVVVLNSGDDELLERERISMLLSMPVDGILSVPVNLENYANKLTPIVFMSRFPYKDVPGIVNLSNQTDYSYVVIDDFEGQRCAAEHLIKYSGENHYVILGSKNTATVGGIKNYIRLDGYKKCLVDSGIAYDDKRVIMNVDTTEEGYNTVLALCKSAKVPFGISLTNDLVSMGALCALGKLNLRVPQDVCVIGYDDIDICSYYNPPITTIHCAKRTIGTYAVQQIVDLMSATNTNNVIRTVLQPHLVLRESTPPLE